MYVIGHECTKVYINVLNWTLGRSVRKNVRDYVHNEEVWGKVWEKV